MGKLATATTCYAADASVGGAMGATRSFYANANLTPDDIDDDDSLTYSSVVTNADQTAQADDS